MNGQGRYGNSRVEARDIRPCAGQSRSAQKPFEAREIEGR